MEKSFFIRITRIMPLTAIISFAVMAFSSVADDGVIYRWIDKNNVVHFSQHQPDHDNYTTLAITLSQKKAQSSVLNNTDEQDKPYEKEVVKLNKDDEKSEIEAAMAQRCEEAKANVKTLMSFDNVQYINPKGEAKVLTATEKNQQITLSEKQVEVYCKK